MSTPNPRPTREQVDTVLAFSDATRTRNLPVGVTEQDVLADEVRALRADLRDLQVKTDREIDAQADALGEARDELERLSGRAFELVALRAELDALRNAIRSLARRYDSEEVGAREVAAAVEKLARTMTDPPPLRGDDVPARFDACAEAVERLDWPGTAYAFRDIASQLRGRQDGAPEARAAVAAALARHSPPTT